MKVVFMAPEEQSYLPIFFDRVVTALGEKVAAVMVVRPIYKGSSWISQGIKFARAFGLKVFLIESVFFAYHKILDFVSRFARMGRFYSVKQVAKSNSVPLYQPQNINSPEFLQILMELSPDLVVSVSCPQIFGEELIKIPSLGCINIHSSLLPEYRGVLPTFWALTNNEQQTGVSVHYISEGVDQGDIMLQQEIEIKSEETLHSLIGRAKKVGAELLLEAIAQLEQGDLETKPNPNELGSYYSFPTREDVQRFREHGWRVR